MGRWSAITIAVVAMALAWAAAGLDIAGGNHTLSHYLLLASLSMSSVSFTITALRIRKVRR